MLHNQANVAPKLENGGKLTVALKLTDDNGSITEWTGSYDLEARGLSNKVGLMERIRLLVRRELINRSMITPLDEDNKRRR